MYEFRAVHHLQHLSCLAFFLGSKSIDSEGFWRSMIPLNGYIQALHPNLAAL